MRDALRLLPVIVRNWLRTRAQLELEILALRHQLSVLQREQDRRPRLTSFDRIFWVWLYRLWPGCLDAVAIPDSLVARKRLSRAAPGTASWSRQDRCLPAGRWTSSSLRTSRGLIRAAVRIRLVSSPVGSHRSRRPPSRPRHAVPRLNRRFHDGCVTFGQSHGPATIHISAIEDWAEPEFGPN